MHHTWMVWLVKTREIMWKKHDATLPLARCVNVVGPVFAAAKGQQTSRAIWCGTWKRDDRLPMTDPWDGLIELYSWMV